MLYRNHMANGSGIMRKIIIPVVDGKVHQTRVETITMVNEREDPTRMTNRMANRQSITHQARISIKEDHKPSTGNILRGQRRFLCVFWIRIMLCFYYNSSFTQRTLYM